MEATKPFRCSIERDSTAALTARASGPTPTPRFSRHMADTAVWYFEEDKKRLKAHGAVLTKGYSKSDPLQGAQKSSVGGAEGQSQRLLDPPKRKLRPPLKPVVASRKPMAIPRRASIEGLPRAGRCSPRRGPYTTV